VFYIPIISETIPSDNSYNCRCDFINDNYDPVCGSNGLTYLNPSEFHCDKKCKNPGELNYYILVKSFICTKTHAFLLY
jgi:hypothetical protein